MTTKAATKQGLRQRDSQSTICRYTLLGTLLVATPFAQIGSAKMQRAERGPSDAKAVLLVQEGQGRVILFSTSDPSRQKIIKVDENPNEIELSPDGQPLCPTSGFLKPIIVLEHPFWILSGYASAPSCSSATTKKTWGGYLCDFRVSLRGKDYGKRSIKNTGRR
jgi:hypothetical protein